jgi:hypothetical protein
MSIFQKLFRGSSKKAPASKGGQWDAVIGKSDLLMAREEIADMHRMIESRGEEEGGVYVFKKEYVAAWEAFRDRPTVDTARVLLDAAPQLVEYFEMCSPGSIFYLASRLRQERTKSG